MCLKSRVKHLGVFQQSPTLMLLQKYHDTNGSRIVIQIGGVCTTFCQEDSMLLQKFRDRNGRCITILFKSIGVRGRWTLLQCYMLKNCRTGQDILCSRRRLNNCNVKHMQRPLNFQPQLLHSNFLEEFAVTKR